MTRKRSQWWTNDRILKLRLRGFNLSGSRYSKAIVTLDEVKQRLKSLDDLDHCYWTGCDKELRGKRVSFDHYIPLARGGKHSAENLVPSCPTCNRFRGAWLPERWIDFLAALNTLGIRGEFFQYFAPSRWRRRRG